MNRFFFLILMLMLASAPTVVAQEGDEGDVLAASRKQIGRFTGDLPAANLKDYGFNNLQEISRITFGDPLPVYTLKDSAMVFTATWRVPVQVDGRSRALLTVIRKNGVYEAVDFGATVLAGECERLRTPATTGLLRVYALRKDYLIEGAVNRKPLFIPIEPAR